MAVWWSRVRCLTETVARLRYGDSGLMPEDLRLWNAIMNRYPIPEPFTIAWTSEVPRSSGLSGSTAMLGGNSCCVL